MDADQQDSGTVSRRWSDSDIMTESQSARDIHSNAFSMQKPDDEVQAKEKVFTLTKDDKEAAGSGNRAEILKQPNRPRSKSPLKKRPFSARVSMDMFRSLMSDEDGRSKRSGLSVGDNMSISTGMSISTCDSVDERRLSDRMKKAWRGATGHKQVDPLHQWMVKHSGGTLRDHRLSREYSDDQ